MSFLIGLCIVTVLIGIAVLYGLVKLKSVNKLIFYLVLGGLAIIVILGLYNGLVIRKYQVSTHKFKLEQPIKIALLTDLHSYNYGKEQEKLLEKLNEQEPDLILLRGDIVDDEEPIKGVTYLLEGLQNTVPIYYVTGNHEYWTGEIEQIKTFLESYGVIVLEEDYRVEMIKGMPIIIAGISDPDKWRGLYSETGFELAYVELEEKVVKERGYKILLSHRPEFVDLYSRGEYDLVVSGHAHGGQVRVPGLINGLYAPGQGGFPKYAGGSYKLLNGSNLIVSRGLSINRRLPRIFNPPELVMVEINGTR